MTAAELTTILGEREWHVRGKHPSGEPYDYGTGVLQSAWDIQDGVGFSIAHHVWPHIADWEFNTADNPEIVLGRYDSYDFPNGPGYVSFTPADSSK